MLIGITASALTDCKSAIIPVPKQVSGLQLWLDAADGSTLLQSSGGAPASANNDPVGQWLDKSGNNRHSSQSTAANKPLLATNTKNGKNTISFDGSNDQLVNATQYDIGTNAFTMYAVLRANTPGAIAVWWEQRNAAGIPRLALYYNPSGTNWNWYHNAVGPTVAGANDTYTILKLQRTGTNCSMATNGNSFTTVSQPSFVATGASFIGVGYNNTQYWKGNVGEILMYNSVLSAGDQAKVLNYLNGKWAIY